MTPASVPVPLLIAAACLLAGSAPPARADSGESAAGAWPQFRGPQRDGIQPASGPLIDSLPDGGVTVAWRRACGAGFAPPSVDRGVVILFHRRDDECAVTALSAGDGAPLWEFAYPATYRDSFGFDDGPRAAPTIHDGRVYTYGAEGMLHCLDLATGAKRWAVDCAAEFASPQGFFGRAGSPLVHQGLVMLNVGGTHSGRPAGIVAVDALTGELRWQATDHEAGYSSPVIRSSPAGPQALFFTRDGFVGVDPSDGRVAFSVRHRSSIDASVNAAMPVICGDRVFLSACYGVGASLWDWRDGEAAPRAAWQLEDRLDCHYATPVHRDGFLYGFHGRQEQRQELRCIEVATGRVRWKSTDLAGGSVALADGKLVVTTEDGELALVEANPEGFRLLLRDQILGRGGRPLPALAGGFLMARNHREIVCVDLRRTGG